MSVLIRYPSNHFNDFFVEHPLILRVQRPPSCHYHTRREVPCLPFYSLVLILNQHLLLSHLCHPDYLITPISVAAPRHVSYHYLIQPILYCLSHCVSQPSTTCYHLHS